MSKLNVEFLENVYLRGLEGMISDKFLSHVVDNETTQGHLNFVEDLENHMAARYIAVQLFFKMKGWAL